MFCTQCGKPNSDGTKFCVECGAQLVTAEPEATPVVEAPVVEAPVVETPAAAPVEAPVVEAPVVEAPVEAPVVEAPAAAPVYENVAYAAPAPQELPCKALGIVSMILGIVSVASGIILCCCGIIGATFSFLLGLAAVITGAIAKSKAKAVGMKNGKATAGLICGIVGMVGFVFFLILYVLSLLGMASSEAFFAIDDNYYYYFINSLKM